MKLELVILALATAALICGGCSYVSLQPQAQDVRSIASAEMGDCDRLGKTTVKVLAKVLGIHRSRVKVAGELSTLARNEAVLMEGNAVAPESEIADGRQVFGIYRCAD